MKFELVYILSKFDRENKSLPFLFNAPSIYGYFMTHGILVNNINQSDIFDSEDHSFTCLKIDTDENILETPCNKIFEK